MPDLAAAYADTRRTMIDLIRGADDGTAGVPACPGWTARDIIAHVASIASALASGEFPADLNPAAFWDPKTAELRETFVDRGLADRASLTLDQIIDEWESSSKTLEAMMRGEEAWPDSAPPLPEWIVLTDLAVHHHDLRGALGAPGDRDSLATGLSLRSYVEGMRFRAALGKTPPFKIVAGSREWVIGEGEPVATVTADPFELARAASGRRSKEQLLGFDWSGDPGPFLGFFYPYGERSEPLVE